MSKRRTFMRIGSGFGGSIGRLSGRLISERYTIPWSTFKEKCEFGSVEEVKNMIINGERRLKLGLLIACEKKNYDVAEVFYEYGGKLENLNKYGVNLMNVDAELLFKYGYNDWNNLACIAIEQKNINILKRVIRMANPFMLALSFSAIVNDGYIEMMKLLAKPMVRNNIYLGYMTNNIGKREYIKALEKIYDLRFVRAKHCIHKWIRKKKHDTKLYTLCAHECKILYGWKDIKDIPPFSWGKYSTYYLSNGRIIKGQDDGTFIEVVPSWKETNCLRQDAERIQVLINDADG